jgi:predicted DsbA family dithiol-disulfide isomerase
MKIEIWSDVVCPWCYLGKRRLETALATFPHADDVEVTHRAFQLDPSAPDDHTVDTASSLAGKYGMSVERAEQLQREMEQRAAADGLEYHLEGQRTGNTLAAHRLTQLAQARGRQEELTERLFRAHFTEARSVFERDSLLTLAVEAGLNADEAARVLDSDEYADAVEVDLDQGREYGISGVPFYVIDGRYGISGAQPAAVLSQALEQAWAEAH